MDDLTLTDDDVTTEYGRPGSGTITADADTTDATDTDTTDADTDDSDQDADSDDPSL
jgi:hypothetical protein